MRYLLVPMLLGVISVVIDISLLSAQTKLLPRDNAAIHLYFNKHTSSYPRALQDARIPGTVHASYTIQPDGTVSDIILKSDAFPEVFEPEILRVIKSMKFVAGKMEIKQKDFLFRLEENWDPKPALQSDPDGPIVLINYKPIICTRIIRDTVVSSAKPLKTPAVRPLSSSVIVQTY
ncbi:TonB protein C-terminal [Chitinophaga jiangningensis]|uniref:TonB protein C-terminal n=1 Tax=Chitinophaga jiangningensis TaxID=1419482 RepID=A0A1M7EMS6_9BACT|nr:energy transducer TonB [Chitinophaga jiangningensis]SHL93122.1 TonB protein C-terminal [Chitinophaga jiangningensis]